MSTPTTMNVVRVRGGFDGAEWATVCWHSFQATGVDGKPRECGEILIHSSFGSWANSWGHCGVSFDKFLMKIERGYCADKFMGEKARVFDGEATVRELRTSLIEARRTGGLTRNDARSIWDWIEENELDLQSGGNEFVYRMNECAREAEWEDALTGRPDWDTGPGRGALHFLEEPWDRIRTDIDKQFEGFWRDLWPVFIEHLKQHQPNPA